MGSMSIPHKTSALHQLPLFRLLIGCVCISFAPIFIKLAALPPDTAGFYRMLIAALSLFLLLRLQRLSLQIDRRTKLFLLGSGLFLGIDFMCWHRSIALVGPGLSTLIANFQVFFTALFSWLFLRQKISRLFIVSVIMALAGLQLVTGADWSVVEAEYLWGIAFGLLAGLFYSGYLLLVKEAMGDPRVSSVAAMLLVAVSSTLLLSIITPLGGASFAIPSSRSFLSIAGAGLISTTIGWSLISSAIKYIPVTVTGLVLLLQPTLALIWDVLLFGRPTGVLEVVGILLILLAIYIGSSKR